MLENVNTKLYGLRSSVSSRAIGLKYPWLGVLGLPLLHSLELVTVAIEELLGHSLN